MMTFDSKYGWSVFVITFDNKILADIEYNDELKIEKVEVSSATIQVVDGRLVWTLIQGELFKQATPMWNQ